MFQDAFHSICMKRKDVPKWPEAFTPNPSLVISVVWSWHILIGTEITSSLSSPRSGLIPSQWDVVLPLCRFWLHGPVDQWCMCFCSPVTTMHEWTVISLSSNQRLVSSWLTGRSLRASDESRVKGPPGDQEPWQSDGPNFSDSLKWIKWALLWICLHTQSQWRQGINPKIQFYIRKNSFLKTFCGVSAAAAWKSNVHFHH